MLLKPRPSAQRGLMYDAPLSKNAVQCCRRSGGNSGTAKATPSTVQPPAVNEATAAPAQAPPPTSAPLAPAKAPAPVAPTVPAVPTAALSVQPLAPAAAGSAAPAAPAAAAPMATGDVPASKPGITGASTGRRTGEEQPKPLVTDFMAYIKRLEEVSLQHQPCCIHAWQHQPTASVCLCECHQDACVR